MSRVSLISDSDDSTEKAQPSGKSVDPSSKADATSSAMEDSTLHGTHTGDNNVTDSDKTTSFPAEISVAKDETVPKQPTNPTTSPETTGPSETPPAEPLHQEGKEEEVIAEPSTSAVGFDSEFDDITLTMPREKTYPPKKILCITVTSGSKFVCIVMVMVVIFFFVLLLALVLSVSSYKEPETPSAVNATFNFSSEYTTNTPEAVTHLDYS